MGRKRGRGREVGGAGRREAARGERENPPFHVLLSPNHRTTPKTGNETINVKLEYTLLNIPDENARLEMDAYIVETRLPCERIILLWYVTKLVTRLNTIWICALRIFHSSYRPCVRSYFFYFNLHTFSLTADKLRGWAIDVQYDSKAGSKYINLQHSCIEGTCRDSGLAKAGTLQTDCFHVVQKLAHSLDYACCLRIHNENSMLTGLPCLPHAGQLLKPTKKVEVCKTPGATTV